MCSSYGTNCVGWWILSTSSLLLLHGPPWPGVAQFVRVPSMSQISLFKNDFTSITLLDITTENYLHLEDLFEVIIVYKGLLLLLVTWNHKT